MIKCRDGKFLSAKEFSVCATGHDLYVVRCTADKIILVVALSVLKTVLSLVLNNFVHLFCLVVMIDGVAFEVTSGFSFFLLFGIQDTN